ncbi:MAG: hypothetical protein JWN71_2930 [Xanthobacteraceae bacterium]|jgi:hypothetical protein|nr:hypothetical protein [Xanthobacteraceae bacterium]
MNLLAFLIGLTAFVALYVVWLRPWLRDKPWAQGFFAGIEPVEIALWRKSESILWARFLQAVGLVVPLLQFVGAVDIAPYLAIVPEGYAPYLLLVIFVAGQIGERLRKDTTKPLDVVALPEADRV